MSAIKSFKKFIEESIWSDIQDRSSGDTVRKEDDINTLDLNEFYAYIKDQYKTKVEYIDLDAMGGENGDVLGVDITENVILFYKPKRGHILLSWSRAKIPMPFFDELIDRFKVENPNGMRKIITEKDGSCTNKTFVDVIDFFLGHKESMMNESIWSDIQDRSAGDTVRKEDEYDIDEKELERSVDTCIKTYVIGFIYYDKYDGSSDTFLKCIQEWDRNICQNAQLYDRRFGKYVEPIKVIPSYVKKNWETGKSYKSLVDKKMSEEEKKVKDTGFIKKPGESISDTLSKWFDENFEKLGDDFCEEIEEYNERYHNEGGSMSVDLGVEDWWDNLEYIEQVEIYQDYMKKTNESIWSDIQDRSAGDTVRQEDISEEDKKEIDYIFNGFAYLIVFTYYEPTIDDFIKMMKEAHPDKDNSKYIAWVKSNWDKKYKDELDKKIQYYKTYIDKKINRYLNHFVAQIVYCEKYNVSLIDIKKFADEVYKNGGMPLEMSSVGEIDVNESWYDIFKKYVDENWNDVKKRINDFIVEENQKIAKTGFKKTPGKKICDILDEWWYSLGDEKEDIAWDEFGERAEDKYYEEHDPEYNEYTGEDFEADDEWANASWIESVEIYMKYNQKTNESIRSDIQDRSAGDTVRKEDEMTYDDFIMLRATAKMFRVGVRNYSNPKKRKYTLKRIDGCDGFIDYILEKKKEHFWNDTPDETYDKAINFVKNNWGDCTGIQEFIDKCLNNINECDGVPGGLTPADVGGMGPAYFPGPNGEPGSGDLPSPTGIVYKQVAPFDTFIKIRKQKKKKKKFRKEDEPCAHSPNEKVYDYVDDFRDYVDRTYNNIDKRK